MGKIVIVGATGKVGSKVASQLLTNGKQVVLISRSAEKLEAFKHKGAEVQAFSMLEVEKLAKALTGADVVLTMIASNHLATDFIEDQRQQADAQVAAIVKSGIKNVVNLSSVGCHVIEGNGVIQGLTEMEVKLNQLKNVNVIHLRPTFYLENTFYALGLIKHQGIYGLPIHGDKKFPMIATQDVADAIVKQLTELSFKGKSVQPILGAQDYSLSEVTEELRKAIGKDQLPYIQFSAADFTNGNKAAGGSESFADRFTELMIATDNGLLNYHERTLSNTTKTTLTDFAKNVFAPAYQYN
jgi:uncharacterized protein YbjT (DUF2867 family)